MRNSFFIRFSVIAVAFFALMQAHGFAGQKIEVRVSACNSMEHPQTLGLLVMKDYVEKHTDGNVLVHVFPNSQLGGELESVEQVQMGTLEMATASIGPIVTFQEKFAVLDIPFLFNNYLEAWAVLDSKVGTDLLDTLQEAGLFGLAYMENGYRHTTNNNRPITKLEDFSGLKIRTMQAPLHIESFKSLKANPTPIPFPEVYMALSQRIADGQENPIANIWELKLSEVQKYTSLTGHIYDAMPLVTNLKWFQNLPGNYQEVIRTGAILGQNYSRFINAGREDMIIARLREQGMQVNELSAEAKDAIKNVAQPVVAGMVAKNIGKDNVDLFLKGIEQIREDVAKSVD